MILLGAEKLSVSLGKQSILKDVTFQANAPQLIGLVGPNGAGKTTLIRSLAGQQSIHSGSATLQGQDLEKLTTRERAKSLAYLPQQRNVHWPLSVSEVVMLGRHPHRSGFASPGKQDIEAVRKALTQMEVTGFADRPFKTLSGGEQARVLMARALAQETPILLADEPMAGLDSAHQISLMQHFRRIVQAGQTVLLSIHEISLAARWCDRVLVLQDGVLKEDGTPEQVLSEETLSSVFQVGAYLTSVGNRPLIVPLEPTEEPFL